MNFLTKKTKIYIKCVIKAIKRKKAIRKTSILLAILFEVRLKKFENNILQYPSSPINKYYTERPLFAEPFKKSNNPMVYSNVI